MTFWGTTRIGDRLLLGEPAEAVLSFDADAPADLLRVKFPADKLWEELREVRLEESGETAFWGIVDEQNTSLSASGIVVELVCRSPEALLLDNEAAPGTVRSPSLELLEKRLLAPAGLSLGEGDRTAKRGSLTIDKGESCWIVLERFCRDFLNVEPFVDQSGRVQCGGIAGRQLELSQVISARVELLPCKRISQVWQQSFRGSYDTLYRSERAGFPRSRYVGMESKQDPRQLLRQGEQDSFLLTVTCAGAWWPGRNAAASVSLPKLGRFEGCPVRAARYLRDENGETTKLTLERGAEQKEDGICG